MQYYLDTVFLFMEVMCQKALGQHIPLEKEEGKIYIDVYLYSVSASNSGPCLHNFYITLTGCNISVFQVVNETECIFV